MSAIPPLDSQISAVYSKAAVVHNYKEMKEVYKDFENISVGKVGGNVVRVKDLVEYSNEEKSSFGKVWKFLRILNPWGIHHSDIDKLTDSLHPQLLICIHQLADKIEYDLDKIKYDLTYKSNNMDDAEKKSERKIIKHEMKDLSALTEIALKQTESKRNVDYIPHTERRNIIGSFYNSIGHYIKEENKDPIVDKAFISFIDSMSKNEGEKYYNKDGLTEQGRKFIDLFKPQFLDWISFGIAENRFSEPERIQMFAKFSIETPGDNGRAVIENSNKLLAAFGLQNKANDPYIKMLQKKVIEKFNSVEKFSGTKDRRYLISLAQGQGSWIPSNENEINLFKNRLPKENWNSLPDEIRNDEKILKAKVIFEKNPEISEVDERDFSVGVNRFIEMMLEHESSKNPEIEAFKEVLTEKLGRSEPSSKELAIFRNGIADQKWNSLPEEIKNDEQILKAKQIFENPNIKWKDIPISQQNDASDGIAKFIKIMVKHSELSNDEIQTLLLQRFGVILGGNRAGDGSYVPPIPQGLNVYA